MSDPMLGWYDRIVERGEDLDMYRRIYSIVATCLGTRSYEEFKSFGVTMGYGSKETMEILFPSEEEG